MEHLRIVWNIW